MIKNIIGENAGKIWTVLNDNGQLSIKELKTKTKLTDKDLYLALGWLSKEHKVRIEGDTKDFSITLI